MYRVQADGDFASLNGFNSPNNVNLIAGGETNVLAEYTLHNLSDADFTYFGPAVDSVLLLLQAIALQFGFHASDADYNNEFRNSVLSFFTGERLLIIYSGKGIDAVAVELQKLSLSSAAHPAAFWRR